MPPTDEISMLTSKELTERLMAYGVNVGPIVQTTRSLYENKLRRLESGEVPKPKYEEVPDDEDDEEDEESQEEETEEVPVQVRDTRNEPRRRGQAKVTPSRVAHPEPMIQEMSSRAQQRTQPAPSSGGNAKSKGFPVWTVLFILIILAAIGYLIIKNMEPETESSIPNQIDAEV